MRALADAGKIGFVVAQIAGLEGSAGKLSGVRLKSPEQGEFAVSCDTLLPFYGLTMKLGPIADFGLNLHENHIVVDTAAFESSVPGIFAIGRSEEHTSELQSLMRISYAVFCMKKKN